MHSWSFSICSLVLATLLSTVHSDRFYGIAYTPFRIYQHCPTNEEVESDVRVLRKHTSRVRIYSTECKNVNRILLRHSTEGGLSVLLGVWIDDRPTDGQEIKFLIEALQEYPNANIEGIVVGNEVIHRNIYLKPLLLGRITEVRNRVRGLGRYPGYSKLLTVPIFAVEEKPDDDVSANSDMLGLNIHPFYDPNLKNADDPEIMSDIILNAAKMQMEKYWNSSRHKQLVVTEIGWPSQSSPSDNDLHKGDTILAVRFIEKFSKYCQESGIPYYWFEMFDSLWKKGEYPTAQDSFSEFHFGIYEKDRTNMKKIPGRDRKLKLLK